MDKQEKRRFIEDLTADIREEAINKIAMMPPEWDGIELRWYLAEKFQERAIDATNRVVAPANHRQRRQDYKTAAFVRNL